MSSSSPLDLGPGPFCADQIRPGDPYELHDGHPVLCSPQGGQGALKTALGALIILSDPAVENGGIDPGFSPEEKTLRAPDIGVGNVPNAPGWIEGVPQLAVEYADTGQDERQLQAKIRTFLEKGTKHIWVVRLVGMPRVEVYEAGRGVRTLDLDSKLEAPDILKNPVTIRSLFERDEAFEVALRNLLQRKGYQDWDDLIEKTQAEGRESGWKEGREVGRKEGREEGRKEGRREGHKESALRIAERLLRKRFGDVPASLGEQVRLLDAADLEELAEVLMASATFDQASEWLRGKTRG